MTIVDSLIYGKIKISCFDTDLLEMITLEDYKKLFLYASMLEDVNIKNNLLTLGLSFYKDDNALSNGATIMDYLLIYSMSLSNKDYINLILYLLESVVSDEFISNIRKLVINSFNLSTMYVEELKTKELMQYFWLVTFSERPFSFRDIEESNLDLNKLNASTILLLHSDNKDIDFKFHYICDNCKVSEINMFPFNYYIPKDYLDTIWKLESFYNCNVVFINSFLYDTDLYNKLLYKNFINPENISQIVSYKIKLNLKSEKNIFLINDFDQYEKFIMQEDFKSILISDRLNTLYSKVTPIFTTERSLNLLSNIGMIPPVGDGFLDKYFSSYRLSYRARLNLISNFYDNCVDTKIVEKQFITNSFKYKIDFAYQEKRLCYQMCKVQEYLTKESFDCFEEISFELLNELLIKIPQFKEYYLPIVKLPERNIEILKNNDLITEKDYELLMSNSRKLEG